MWYHLYYALSPTHHMLHHTLIFHYFPWWLPKLAGAVCACLVHRTERHHPKLVILVKFYLHCATQPVIMPVLSRPLEHTMPESDEDVQNKVSSKTGIQPCLWQFAVVCLILEQWDVITVAETGSGKSLTYWMALLYIKYVIVLLVTRLKLPLNTVEWLSSLSMVRILSSNRLSIANCVAVFHCLFSSYIPKTHTAHLIHTGQLTCWQSCMFLSTCSLSHIYTSMLLHTRPFNIWFWDLSGQMLCHNQACTYCHYKFWQSP